MIRELKTLVAVAREGTFAAAGNRIGLTQAAVSAQMQRLEAELGFALFDRQGRSARLNEMGHHVLDQAQALLGLYDNLSSTAPGSPAAVRVTIGAIASVQSALLPAALADFHRRHPACRTRVIPGLSIELVNRVDAGEIDMAAIIRPPFSLQSDLHWTTLAQEPFRLIVPRSVKGKDWAALLASEPFVRYDRASFGGRQVDRFLRKMHIAVRDTCELDELDAIVKLVENGVGVALVPQTGVYRRWPAGVRAMHEPDVAVKRVRPEVDRARRTMSEPAQMLAQLIETVAQAT